MTTLGIQVNEQYQKWKAELITITAMKTLTLKSEIRINDTEAFSWYKDGFTPYQCFRETWNNENDSDI